jgi:uncharacterized protein YjdB
MKRVFLFAAVMFAALVAVSCNSNENEVLAVRLDKTKIELVKGESIQLNAQVVPAQDAEFTWSSQDEQYVTVDQNGVVTAVGLKKESLDSDEVSPVSVYVKYLNGADECQVTVLPLAPTKVEIVSEANTIEVDPAESIQLVAKCYPEDADLTDLTWSTDFATVAKVDSKTGVLTGVSAGFAVIRVSYNERIFDEINVRVNAVDPQAVEIVPSSLTLSKGMKERLSVQLTPSNASGNLIWTSDDMSVATVDSETGVVTAVAVGTANIKVQIGKISATCVVVVE